MNRRKSASFIFMVLLNVASISIHMTLASIIDSRTVNPKLDEVTSASLHLNVGNNNDTYKTTDKDKWQTLEQILKNNVNEDGTWKDNDDTKPMASDHLTSSCANHNDEVVLDGSDKILISNITKHLKDLIKEGEENAEKILHAKFKAIENMRRENRKLALSSSHGRASNSESNQLEQCRGFVTTETAKLIVKKFDIPNSKTAAILSRIDVKPFIDDFRTKYCKDKEKKAINENCNGTSLYRTYSGRCNNLNTDELGASMTRFKRFLKPIYGNGFNSMRKTGSSGESLPNPRTVSRSLANILNGDSTDLHMTQMLKAWGQFTDHDLTFTREGHGACCDNQTDDPFDRQIMDSECQPIDVRGDHYFHNKKVNCLRFIRNEPDGSKMGYREQINTLTAFIDSSNVYGSTDEEAKQLRANEGGRLKENDNGEDGSCTKKDRTSQCKYPFLPKRNTDNATHYYHAGDERVNEQPGLIAMHTLMFRFHNKVADALKKTHNYNDNVLFEETRRIVIACAQHITYNEFLLVLLGKDYVNKYNLSSSSEYKYDETLDPSIRNEFATFALRMGHTLIGKQITGKETIPLEKAFEKPLLTINNASLHPSDVLKGECTNPSEKFDIEIVDAVVDNLLIEASFPFGSDLFALNIQRGRDHGLPHYNEVRKFCCKRPFTDWEDMKSELNPKAVVVLEKNYGGINDVDVFPAAIAERRTSFGFIGDTLSCVLAKQFSLLKFGDRFWYQNKELKNGFDDEQLSVIQNVTLSSIICATSNIKTIQPFPMLSSTLKGNEEKNCEDIVNNFNLISQIEKHF